MWCCGVQTVFDGVLEEHQIHGHQTRRLAVVLQLSLHEPLQIVAILQVLIDAGFIQEIACSTGTSVKATIPHGLILFNV